MKNLFLIAIISLVLMACGGKKPQSISEEVAAFVGQNENIATFGLVRVSEILNKADYKQIEKAGTLIDGEWQTIQKVLNTEEAVYFALATDPKNLSQPATVYAFAEVKNRDSLVANVKKHGYSVKKGKAFDLHESGDVAFAITENRVVLVATNPLTGGRAKLKKAIAEMKKEIKSEKVSEILKAKGDIVFGSDIQASAMGAAKSLKLKDKELKNVQETTKDCYTTSSVFFENGQMRMEMNYELSDKMKGWVSYGNGQQEVLSKLGSGKPQMGLIMDIDMNKTMAFWNSLFPNFMDLISQQAGGQAQFALAMLGDKGLAGAITGRMGVLMFNDKTDNKTEFNFHVGVGNEMLNMAKSFSEGMKANMAKLNVSGNYFTGATSAKFANAGKITLPEGCENFGKKPISMFFDFNGLENSPLGTMSGGTDLTALDYMFGEGDEKGFTMILKTKKSSENVLKTIVGMVEKNIELRNSQYETSEF